MLEALWTWCASLHFLDTLTVNLKGSQSPWGLQRPLVHNHKNHKAFVSPVLYQLDNVKYGITTGPCKTDKGEKD